MKRTVDAMNLYVETKRARLLVVTQRLQGVLSVITELRAEGIDERTLAQLLYDALEELDMAGLLHAFDPFGFLLANDNYLFADEVVATMASEVARVLIAQPLVEGIDNLLSNSSMRGVPRLQQRLRAYQIRESRREGIIMQNGLMNEQELAAYKKALRQKGRTNTWTREDNLKTLNRIRAQSGDEPLTMAEFIASHRRHQDGKADFERSPQPRASLPRRLRTGLKAFLAVMHQPH